MRLVCNRACFRCDMLYAVEISVPPHEGGGERGEEVVDARGNREIAKPIDREIIAERVC